jgi:hypothetical protein
MKSMPTIARPGPYRVFFYSHDVVEPPHVRVSREHAVAKFSLQPVALASSLGFPSQELRSLLKLIQEKAPQYLEKWNERTGNLR